MAPDSDWAAETADRIDHAVLAVRAKTADPLIGVSRWVVYGLLAAIVGAMALLVMIIGLVRVMDVYLPSGVWLPDVILGGIFALGGLFLWSRRTISDTEG